MQLVNIHGANDVRVDEVAKPEIGAADVLLRVDACGICGSDLTFAKYGMQRQGGGWPLGHEAAGTVVAAGPAVEGLEVGARVLINPMGAMDNIIGNGGSEGAFADYLLVRGARPGQHLLPVPKGLPAEVAALAEPFAVALHGVNQAGLSGDEKVVVYGAGPIGLAAVFWLNRRGLRDVVSVDLSDARLARARELGAAHTVNPSARDLREALLAIHGEAGPMFGQATVATDVFIDMAGAAVLLEQTVAMAKFQSRIVLTAVYPQPVALNLEGMLIREMSFKTAVGYPTELGEALDTLGRIDLDDIGAYVSHRYDFGDFPQAFETAKDRNSAKVMVVMAH
ncbi:MAG: zinc-binding dehydrogenase [Porticoccaceae bacterium]